MDENSDETVAFIEEIQKMMILIKIQNKVNYSMYKRIIEYKLKLERNENVELDTKNYGIIPLIMYEGEKIW